MVAHARDTQLIEQVQHWLREVVIGLNLCPFAAKPVRENRVHFAVSQARADEALLLDLFEELSRLDAQPELETTLLLIPDHLQNFLDFNQFLDLSDWLLERNDWLGSYQLAHFHPHYQFAGTVPDDAENLTNRAPCAILHLLREASIEAALQHYPDPEQIPERNVARVQALTEAQKRALFPYLSGE